MNPGLNHLSGEKAAHWKGGRRLTTQGYVALRINGKDVVEHRFIMEEIVGRKLLKHEVVHHINHNRTDNRPENLMLLTNSYHTKHHTIERWKNNPLSFQGTERCGAERTYYKDRKKLCRFWKPCPYHST